MEAGGGRGMASGEGGGRRLQCGGSGAAQQRDGAGGRERDRVSEGEDGGNEGGVIGLNRFLSI